jgi:hypothetical protein
MHKRVLRVTGEILADGSGSAITAYGLARKSAPLRTGLSDAGTCDRQLQPFCSKHWEK